MVLAQLSCTIFYKEKTGLVLQCRDQEELERMLRERTSSGSFIHGAKNYKVKDSDLRN